MTQLEKYQSRLWLLKTVTDLILSMFVLPPPISPHFMLKQKPFLQGRAMCLHSKNEKIKQQRGSFLFSQSGKVLNSGHFLSCFRASFEADTLELISSTKQ